MTWITAPSPAAAPDQTTFPPPVSRELVRVDAPPSARSAKGRQLLLISLLVCIVVAIAFACDGLVQHMVPPAREPSTMAAARFISRYFDWPFMLMYAVVPLTAGFLCCSPKWKRIGLALLLASCLAGGISTAIRSTTGRTRPNADVPQGWYGVRYGSHWTIGDSKFNSFPSGHMGTAMGFACILLFALRRWGWLGLCLGGVVGWSRIYLGYHHFSDVLVASLIGLGIAWFIWVRLLPRLTARWPAALA
jgi:membrane-associated phospholipid phosphatase